MPTLLLLEKLARKGCGCILRWNNATSKSSKIQRLTRNTANALAKVDEAKAQGVQPALAELLGEDSWRKVLMAEFDKPYWTQLQQFLHEEWASKKIFPPQHLIFRSFSTYADKMIHVQPKAVHG